MPVVAFSHIAMRVSDLDQALALYRTRLGFRPLSRLVVVDAPSFRQAGLDDVEMTALFLEHDDTVIELQAVRSRSAQPIPAHLNTLGFRHLAVRVENLDDTVASVESGGGSVEWATRTTSDSVGGQAVFGADPDGQRLEFVQLHGGPSQIIGEEWVEPSDTSPPLVFDRVGVGVTDLDRSIAFYTSCLGASVESADDRGAVVRIGATRIGIEAADDTLGGGADPVGLRRLYFDGPDAARIADPDGPRIVLTGPVD